MEQKDNGHRQWAQGKKPSMKRPDHIHGILFVKEKIERHLGHVINGFKTGTRQAARQLGALTAAMPQPTEHPPVKYAE